MKCRKRTEVDAYRVEDLLEMYRKERLPAWLVGYFETGNAAFMADCLLINEIYYFLGDWVIREVDGRIFRLIDSEFKRQYVEVEK